VTVAPNVNDALTAFDEGDEETLALYLASSAPDHRVLAAILRALSADGETDYRLTFIRRKQGQPPADPVRQAIKDAAIYWDVENLYQDCLLYGCPERGLRKTTIGIVATARSQPDRTVRLAYERCKIAMAE
jgi:hypothetical protein